MSASPGTGDGPAGSGLARHGVLAAAAVFFALALLTAPFAPLFDPDEGYYPGTAVESVDAGSPWDPRFNGEARWDKPILTYALIEASFAAFGPGVVAARVPSAIEGALLVLIAGTVVSRLAGRRAGALSATILATTVGVQIFSRVAHPEIGVVLAITTANFLAVAWLTARRRRPGLALLLGVVIGLGILFKGPVALVLPALAAIVAAVLMPGRIENLWLAARDAMIAFTAALAVAVPWYAAMYLRHGTSFIYEALWRHNVGRYTADAFGHGSPPWALVVPALAAVLPWTLFVPSAWSRVSRRDVSDKGVLRLMMAVSAATSFAFYSASVSKLPHYALVVVPPLAVLVGLYLDEAVDQKMSARTLVRATALLMAGLGLVCAVAPLFVNERLAARQVLGGVPDRDARLLFVSFARMLWPVAAVLAASAVAMWAMKGRRALVTIAAVGAIVPMLLLAGGAPLLRRAYPWERFAHEIRATTLPVWLIGPRAPSLTFYARRPVAHLSESDVGESSVPELSEAWIVADERWLSKADAARTLRSRDIEIVDRAGSMALARVRPSRFPGGGCRSRCPWRPHE